MVNQKCFDLFTEKSCFVLSLQKFLFSQDIHLKVTTIFLSVVFAWSSLLIELLEEKGDRHIACMKRIVHHLLAEFFSEAYKNIYFLRSW